LKGFVRERTQIKISNILYMKKMVDDNECRREFILHYFAEEVLQKPSSCCDICGVNLSNYQAPENTLSLETLEEKWKDYLTKILINCELSE